MTDIPNKETFKSFYKGQAPWDIGRPQKVFVDAADQVSGSVLDAGCGTGENALYFAARGQDVTGIDFLEEPICRARQKGHERSLSARFLVKDALQLVNWNAKFDNAIDCGLFHVFSDDDRRRYVRGLAAVLKPGGRLFCQCFSDAEHGEQGPRRIAKAELETAFAEGWTLESVTPCRVETVPVEGLAFSEGGPKAWFFVARRL